MTRRLKQAYSAEMLRRHIQAVEMEQWVRTVTVVMDNLRASYAAIAESAITDWTRNSVPVTTFRHRLASRCTALVKYFRDVFKA